MGRAQPFPSRLAPRLATLAGVMLACAAGASTVESADIRFIGASYHYRFSARVEAGADAVREVVTDYDHLERINPNVVESRVLVRYGDSSLKRQLLMKQCVLVFCFDIDFIERVDFLPNGDIVTTVVPGEGNFRRGATVWRIEALSKTASRITMEADQEPDFFVPPVIGPFIMKRKFLSEVDETMRRIEEVARALPVR